MANILQQYLNELMPMVEKMHGYPTYAYGDLRCACGWRPEHEPRTPQHWDKTLQNHIDRQKAIWHDRTVDLIG